MKTSRLFVLGVTALGLTCGAAVSPASADSLYKPGKTRNMFADHKAQAVGDVVTVLVTENTVATQDGNSKTQRGLSATASGGQGFFFNLLNVVPKASLGGSTKQDGSGSTSRSSKVVSTITVKVSEVTPTGQLVLTGERFIKTNADTQIIKFTGTVRPEDIAPDNTILSGSVADARIEVSGKGPIDRHVRTGILSRIFQFLF